MKCPFCWHLEDRVVDSREAKIGDTIRRRRECARCGRRFTTYERLDEVPHMIVKKDGRREKFDRQKLMLGLMKACERRPIPPNSSSRSLATSRPTLPNRPTVSGRAPKWVRW